VTAELGWQLGQSWYVENKPGGAGTLAMQALAKSAPDGHTTILGQPRLAFFGASHHDL
jgi:tripartite-type tricarboxylate transporter receptor subunit TctC